MASEKDIKKARIRKAVLARRQLMSRSEWEKKSGLIYQQVINHPAFLHAQKIFVYADANNEADTSKIILKAWESGKLTAVPRVRGKEMDFRSIDSFKQLELSTFKVPEPKLECEIIQPDNNTLVIMPGVVFDIRRNRIGYGGGYYDRFLAACPELPTIALAFALQMAEAVPVDVYDKRPDVLITESKIYTE